MEVAVYVHAETLINQWVTFTVTSSRISRIHANYYAGSIYSESDALIDKSLSLQPKGYFIATYSAESESNSYVELLPDWSPTHISPISH